ncbi:MAG: hypothetical protein DRR16_31945 [Candidatus Parabeggiatoa sp. nov. 3]|nr:MAG: hypothetical protein DRR00_19900 [Gammaproteobacteria bacterium]RKZ57910.1 MAG: hypothetical protein DRQ99_26195 [Gammaproteobacteria bacterium]RKZ74637.1 MAG: hypothetical protein DRR16_31945 [Gammaproteobacteria bacterium]
MDLGIPIKDMKTGPQNILVTGGAGFIGSHLVEYLLERGHDVTVLDNFSTGQREYLTGLNNLEIIEGDIGDFETVRLALENITVIFHLAALASVPLSLQAPQTHFRSNILGTFNLFEAARLQKVQRIIFASSSAVYGDNQVLSQCDTRAGIPMSLYAQGKLYGEQLASIYYQVYGLSSVALRYFNVYGPRQSPDSAYSGVISIFIEQLLNGKRPCIYGDGEQTRDFVYVKDVVEANWCAMTRMREGAYVFNVGTGKSIRINQVLELLQKKLETDFEPQYCPARKADIRHSCADVICIREELGWQSQWQIEDGLKMFLDDECFF